MSPTLIPSGWASRWGLYLVDGKTPIALITLDPVIYTVKQDSPWKSEAAGDSRKTS